MADSTPPMLSTDDPTRCDSTALTVSAPSVITKVLKDKAIVQRVKAAIHKRGLRSTCGFDSFPISLRRKELSDDGMFMDRFDATHSKSKEHSVAALGNLERKSEEDTDTEPSHDEWNPIPDLGFDTDTESIISDLESDFSARIRTDSLIWDRTSLKQDFDDEYRTGYEHSVRTEFRTEDDYNDGDTECFDLMTSLERSQGLVDVLKKEQFELMVRLEAMIGVTAKESVAYKCKAGDTLLLLKELESKLAALRDEVTQTHAASTEFHKWCRTKDEQIAALRRRTSARQK